VLYRLALSETALHRPATDCCKNQKTKIAPEQMNNSNAGTKSSCSGLELQCSVAAWSPSGFLVQPVATPMLRWIQGAVSLMSG